MEEKEEEKGCEGGEGGWAFGCPVDFHEAQAEACDFLNGDGVGLGRTGEEDGGLERGELVEDR